MSIDAALALHVRDAGCATTCALLERLVEAELGGEELERRFLGLAAHLGMCPACRADHDGLLALARGERLGARPDDG